MNHSQKKEYRKLFKPGFAITLCFGIYKLQFVINRMHIRVSLGLVALTIYFYDLEARVMYKISN